MKALLTAIAFAAAVAPTVAQAGPEFNVNKFDKGPSWSTKPAANPAANQSVTPEPALPVVQAQLETPAAAEFTQVALPQEINKDFVAVKPMVDVTPSVDVPEPAQAALVLAALMALGLSRRRHSKR